MLTEVIRFGATAEGQPVQAALRGLPGLLGTRPPTPAPDSWLPEGRIEASAVPAGWWHRLVYPEDRPAGTVYRAGYVFCLLEQFHRMLAHRAIYAPDSTRWTDPTSRLLAAATWDAVGAAALHALQLPEDPDQMLGTCADELDAAWRHAAAGVEGDAPVRIDEQARLHAAVLHAIPDPDHLVELGCR